MKTFYRRNLPHYHPPGAIFFVTFRLAGSLPQEAMLRLKQEREATERKIVKTAPAKQVKEEIRIWQKKYFAKFDQLLDSASNRVHHLSDERVANIVTEAIKHRDGKEYDLFAYCIMPNHVHMVFSVERTLVRSNQTENPAASERAKARFTTELNENVERSGASLYKILQSLKSFTAIQANKILNRSGAFWQHESYDHVVRDQDELQRVIRYVLNNPVKAGLVSDWQKWKWSYLKK